MSIGRKSLEDLWLKGVLFALFGYLLLGKGFAYLFLGEMILVIGFIIFLQSQRFMLLFIDPVLFLWAAFAFWGFCRTVPFISTYRIDAIRDAAIWGYGTFALLLVAFVNRSSQISRALNTYRKFLRWYVAALPVLLIFSLSLGGKILQLPWSNGVGLIYLKAGDAAVDVTAAGTFLLIFSDRQRGPAKQGMSIYRVLAFAGWWATAITVLIANRGGAVGMILALLLVSVLRARQTIGKIVAIGVTGAAVGLAVFAILPSNLHVSDKVFNAERVVSTLSTLAGGSDKGTGHEGTAQWRLIWWKKIIDETVFGPYFWTGRGFGVNLAIVDGPAGGSKEDFALRSPHNGSMTILARMGVPGFALWVSLNAVFAFRLLKAQRSAAVSGSKFWSGLNLWILACWLATLTNSTFDVYLEGPQGGIWFWCLIGFGVAALRIQAYEARQSLAASRAQAIRTMEAKDSLAPA